VLSSPFVRYFENNQLLIGDELYDADNELAAKYFTATLEELKSMGITPIVFSPTPQNGENIGECLVKAEFFGDNLDLCDFSLSNISDMNYKAYEFLKNISNNYNVVFLDTGICDDGICRTSINSTFIYRDYGHLSQNGSTLLGKKMRFYDLIVGKIASL
ncbi:MAG: SGNH hydrolase domain-containing protein, partial [Planctomycetota bacterium]